jgi:hypothetical protein
MGRPSRPQSLSLLGILKTSLFILSKYFSPRFQRHEKPPPGSSLIHEKNQTSGLTHQLTSTRLLRRSLLTTVPQKMERLPAHAAQYCETSKSADWPIPTADLRLVPTSSDTHIKRACLKKGNGNEDMSESSSLRSMTYVVTSTQCQFVRTSISRKIPC